ncbi:MAG: hypothetical protein LBM98_08510 [Oscillospiraceae bacterium]|nr:hypothetical protein [Oscillospiraceae bacterium]
MRYVGCTGARQSSAGSVTYVCFPPALDCFAPVTPYVSRAYRCFAMTGVGLRRYGG